MSFYKQLILCLIAFSVLTSSCANVQQIDRGRLARRVMHLNPLPQETSFISHMHSIREASAGGTKKNAGGGCGCN